VCQYQLATSAPAVDILADFRALHSIYIHDGRDALLDTVALAMER